MSPHAILPHPGVRTPVQALVPALVATLLTGACGGAEEPEAYGNFEAEEVTVSAETRGRLVRFSAREGARLSEGAVVAVVDTTTLRLRRDEVVSRRRAGQARARQIAAEVDVLLAQLETAGEELARTERLFAAEAATARELNLQEGEVRRLREQVEAARAGRASALEEVKTASAQLSQIEQQVRESVVRNPVAGTVLATFVETGELVQPGTPLYEIASLDTLTLRAYVDGGQLADVELGETVEVVFDRRRGAGDDGGDEDRATRTGVVTWIAEEAEFTPTPIQTRKERVGLVYAIEIRVANPDGALKVGMPADVRGLVEDGSS